ncbi:MAG: outer membrane protein assembly factor BamB family protein [Planctomycetota bacterium]|jgi:outer membrane protein assembly factor BamB
MRKLTRFPLAVVLTSCCLILTPTDAAAEDWPTYRADNRRSGTTDEALPLPLTLQWTFNPARPPRPAWPEPAEELPRAHCDNAHHVVVAGGTAYFGSSVDDKVYAIDVAGGKIRWSFLAEGPVRFAPTVCDGRVYFGSDDGYVYCLGADDGKLAWKYRPGPSGQKVVGNGRMISAWPVRTSVLVEDGQVFATAGVFPFEGIYQCALDADDGSVIWQNDTVGSRSHELPYGGISPHGYLLASESVLYVPSGRAMPAAFDRKTGALRFCFSPVGKRGGTWALLEDSRLIAGVEAYGRPDKKAYDATTGAYLGDAFTWAPGGIDMVVTPEASHVVKPDGIHTIDREQYEHTRRRIEAAQGQLKSAQTSLSAAISARGCPAEIPKPDVHLSDLDALTATSGWGGVKKDASIVGKALSISGSKYERGIGAHCPSELVYPLRDKYNAFVAVVGVDDEVREYGSVVFQVFIDGKCVHETPTMRGQGGRWNICVPIPPGSEKIRLVASDGADGAGNDHADWAEAGFVTRAAKRIQPYAKSSRELNTRIQALRRRRDLAARALQDAGSNVSVRRFRWRDLRCAIRAGDLVFAGGEGSVIALDPQRGRRLWRAEVEPNAVGLAAADGRLFVSTDSGMIYCFGQKAPQEPRQIAVGAEDDAQPPDAVARAYESAAEKIVADTGITKGYCLIRDCATGRLAVELAKRTDLKIIALAKDPEKLSAARKNVEAAGLLGWRVAVEPWDPSDLPDYFANLIVSEQMLFTRKGDEFPRQLARLLRPCGGTAVFCRRRGDAIVVKKIVRGKLKGAGSWTGLYGNSRNTACSQDRLAKGPFGVLWYGRPGPRQMVERHARTASPVSMDGRLFIEGEESIMAYDAYNGTFLWRRDIPGAVRIRADVDGGNLALTEDALYVAAYDKCHRLETATGRTKRIYTMPRAPDGTPRRWGYIAAAGDILFGSTAAPLERQYADVWKRFVDTERHGWKSEDEIPSDQKGFLSGTFRARYPAPDVSTRRALQRDGGFWRGMGSYPAWRSRPGPQDGSAQSLVCSDAVFALDAETGKLLWVHRGKDIANISITISDGVVYFAQRPETEKQRAAAAEEKQRLIERGVYEPAEPTENVRADVRLLVAVNAADGKVLWKRPLDVTGCGADKMGAACEGGVLLLFGHFSNHDTGRFLRGQLKWRRITALDARDGRVIWSRPLNYLRRPVIVGQTVIIEPRACDLRTGRIKTRRHPISGVAVPWEFLRPGHSCGIASASADTLFYRSFSTAICDLTDDKGLKLFGAIRPGCWLNIISANGLVLMPESSSGCTCSYPIRCSVALVRKPGRIADDGAVFVTHGPLTPVKRLAVNLGATGDTRDEGGRLWLALPRPRAVSHLGYGRYGVQLGLDGWEIGEGGGFFCRDFRRRSFAGPRRGWLFASGCKGLRRCELPLIDDYLGQKPARYTVRLGFMAMPADKPGRRVFDVKLQGRTILRGLDIAGRGDHSKAAIVKELKGVAVKDNLIVELVPRSQDPSVSELPVINFIEAVREDPLPRPQRPSAPIAGDRAREMLAKAAELVDQGKTDAALETYHLVFRAAEQTEARLEALERMTALGRPESLGCIRKCWDGVICPILSGYEGEDAKIVEGMVKLRLAVADKLPSALKAAELVLKTEPMLNKLTDPALRGRLLRKLGQVMDWRLLGPVGWGERLGTVKEVFDAGKFVSPKSSHRLGGALLDWRNYSSNSAGVDLKAAFGAKEYAYAYAHAEFSLQRPRELLLKIAADDAFKCWFNGELVGGSKDLLPRRGGGGRLEVQGRKGVNTILLQVINCGGRWGFGMRVTDRHGRPIVR